MSMCPNDSISPFISHPIHYLITGTFNTVFLYILAFNPTTSTLSIRTKVPAKGPHQFLTINHRICYTTTWAKEPSLSSWSIGESYDTLQHLNTVPITATSSYLQITPDSKRLYSAGGPTGEVHSLAVDGSIGIKLQELLYVEPDELAQADKTRVALRYGSHGIDINLATKQAFVPHLGSNSIYMYDVLANGGLNLVNKAESFGNGKDGPRHVIFSEDGTTLYTVTEHTSFVDVYKIHPASLEHLQRVSVIPSHQDPSRHSYRGDTLRLSLDRLHLFATTRGMTPTTRGYLTAFSIDPSTNLIVPGSSYHHQTATSGGKANAIEVYPFARSSGRQTDWIVLTDDEKGFVVILEWDGENNLMSEIASVRLGEGEEGEGEVVGASHAVWLT